MSSFFRKLIVLYNKLYLLTPRVSGGTPGSESGFFGGTLLGNQLQDFPYYPEIHFCTHNNIIFNKINMKD